MAGTKRSRFRWRMARESACAVGGGERKGEAGKAEWDISEGTDKAAMAKESLRSGDGNR